MPEFRCIPRPTISNSRPEGKEGECLAGVNVYTSLFLFIVCQTPGESCVVEVCAFDFGVRDLSMMSPGCLILLFREDTAPPIRNKSVPSTSMFLLEERTFSCFIFFCKSFYRFPALHHVP